jgi:type IX secretion system substrate protein
LEHFARWTAGDSLAVCGEPVAAHALPVEQGRLALAPNPAQSLVSISAQLPAAYAGTASLTACNILGQPLWQQTLLAAGGEIQTSVDVSAWPPGVYFISLEAGGQVLGKKIVVR